MGQTPYNAWTKDWGLAEFTSHARLAYSESEKEYQSEGGKNDNRTRNDYLAGNPHRHPFVDYFERWRGNQPAFNQTAAALKGFFI